MTEAEIRAEEREQCCCCKDICYFCKMYPDEPAEHLSDETWVHDISATGMVQCHAAPIRERAWQQEQSK